MIPRSLVERMFSAESIERWNDHPRPLRFTEMAKQAHKFVLAWLIARGEEERGEQVDWLALVEGIFCEFLHRVVLTDIKPPVFHHMMEQHGAQLNEWVSRELEGDLTPLAGDFWRRFRQYFSEATAPTPSVVTAPAELSRRILRAAHYLATRWEFGLIRSWGAPLFGIDETGREIDAEIERHRHLYAVDRLLMASAKGDRYGLPAFIDLVGQLRFQKRWTQTPRIPETSVLGHLFFVAALTYFLLGEMAIPRHAVVGTVLAGLFHDLPEVLTRDIISPIKGAVAGLDVFLKRYERDMMEEKIYRRMELPAGCVSDLRCFTEDEFSDRVRHSEGIVSAYSSEIPLGGWPVLGSVVEACDKFAAFVEASLSIRYGISTPQLQTAKQRLAEQWSRRTVHGYDLRPLYDYFA